MVGLFRNKNKNKSADQCDEDLHLKAWHLRGMVLPIRGLVAVAGGILLMVALSIDFSYCE